MKAKAATAKFELAAVTPGFLFGCAAAGAAIAWFYGPTAFAVIWLIR